MVLRTGAIIDDIYGNDDDLLPAPPNVHATAAFKQVRDADRFATAWKLIEKSKNDAVAKALEALTFGAANHEANEHEAIVARTAGHQFNCRADVALANASSMNLANADQRILLDAVADFIVATVNHAHAPLIHRPPEQFLLCILGGPGVGTVAHYSSTLP